MIMPRTLAALLMGLALLLTCAGPAAADRRGSKPAHEVALGQLVNNVRYGQDAAAIEYLDGEAQGAALLEDEWAKGTPEQRAEFIKLFHHLFSGIAFPKMRDSFQYLTTITYDAPKVAGERQMVASVLHVKAGPKEQEIKVTYNLSKTGDRLRVVDVTVDKEKSMLTEIREEQIKAIMAKGGWPKLLELLNKRAAGLPAPHNQPLQK
jgi:ABC-type transporter MlaC component